jgi:repressor LexA
MHTLPPRQAAVLAFIQREIREQGLPPTLPEIATEFGYESVRAAAKHVEKLAAKGAIERIPGTARGIRLIQGTRSKIPTSSHRLPLVGRIAAGKPILSNDQIEDTLDVDPGVFRPRAHFLFRVRGESMVGVGILSGDLIGIHEQPTATNGQIVAVVIPHIRSGDPEITLKRFKQRGNVVTLFSENPDQAEYPPLRYDLRQQEMRIVGLYAGLIRPGAEVRV